MNFWVKVMGCVNSKHMVRFYGSLGNSSLKNMKKGIQDYDNDDRGMSKDKENHHLIASWNGDGESSNFGSINLKFERIKEAEHVGAGWPSWLSEVAGEAIDGWLPLRSDSFERLEKGNRVKKTTRKPNHMHPFLPSSSYTPNFRVKIRFYHYKIGFGSE